MKTNILVLFGGVSTEHEISCISASFVIDSLNSEKYNIYKIGITKDGEWYSYTGSTQNIKNGSWLNDKANLRPALVSPSASHKGFFVFDNDGTYTITKLDVVFPVLHGKNGEDGTVQGLLSLACIPFVGCGTYASAVTMDKAATKIICEEAGIKTAPFMVARNVPAFDIDSFCLKVEEAFGYPVFVKPANSGSSVGITKAKNREMLKKGLSEAFTFDFKVVVEQNIKGKEIEAAIIGNETPLAVCCGEICPNSDFYDYDTKYITDSSVCYIPPRIDTAVAERVCREAEKVFSCLDCRGLSRADFFVDGDSIVFNEINTIPGFTPISMYPKLMSYGGKDVKHLLDELIALAMEAKR